MTHLAALLPVRLETRFLPPGHTAEHPQAPSPGAPGTWRLRLRVVPDTLSLDRHDPAVTSAEERGLAALWASLATAPDPADPVGSARAASREGGWADAFGRLAAQVGPARAAWLVRTVPAERTARGVEVGTTGGAEPRGGAAVVTAFPAAVDVWAVWGGGQVETLHVLHPDRAALATASPVPSWLTSWDGAVAVGLAAEIELAHHPEELEVLGVSGLQDDPAELVALLGAHAAAGALSLTGPGAATSIVHGAPVLPTGRDVREWLDEAGAMAPLPARTLAALLGDQAAAALDPVPGAGDDALDALLVRATFPALWGYGAAGVLGLVDPADTPRLWRWAGTWFRPQGAYATVVVDGTAYGVLPVVDPGRVAAAGIGPALAPVRALLDPVGRAIDGWRGAADLDRGVVGGGVRDVVATLRRGPVPHAFGRARLQSVDLLAAVTDGDVLGARAAWDRGHDLSVHVLGGPPGRRYRASGEDVPRVRLPLIVPPTGQAADPETAVEDARNLLEQWRDDWLFEPVELGLGQPVRIVYAHREFQDSAFHLDRTHPATLLHRLLLRSVALAGVSFDLLRQSVGVPLDPRWGPEPPPGLLEDLVLRGRSTHARRHLNALAGALVDHGFDGTAWGHADPELVEELVWLATEGFDRVRDLPVACVDDAAHGRAAHRALGALLETAAGRWDAWWDAVGAAHVADVQRASPGPATAGVHGWVDAPWRGTPGPGPGGLLLAPSQAQAATAAALRDRAVHDDDGRWELRLDSATVGPARALLADIGQGWHPAEAVGRLIEERLVERSGPLSRVGSAELVALRAAFPLRTGQGHFGCCHGLRVLAEDVDRLPPVGAPGALGDALDEVRAILATAADLVVAEAVHGVLAGRPERAAVATEALAGQLSPGPLDLLEADHPGRVVHTLVLAALPRTGPPPDGGGVLAAAPAFDAALRALGPGIQITLPGAGGPTTLPLTALGLAPVHAAVLADTALGTLAALRAGQLGIAVDWPTDGTVPPLTVTGAEPARLLRAALAGRAPDPVELVPPGGPAVDGAPPPDVVAVREAAAEDWRRRIAEVAAAADAVAQAAASAAEEARSAWRSALDLDEQPTGYRQLADHVLALAAWGEGPDPVVAGLVSDEPGQRDAALAATLAHLDRGASRLAARAAAARTRTATPAVLAELAAGRDLPVGTPAPLTVLGEQLEPAEGTATLTEWLPALAEVRRALTPLAGVLALPGVACSAVDPGDPWRLAALAPQPGGDPDALRPPDPRLTVVLDLAGAAGPDREFVVVDAFSERVPDPAPDLGLAFDAATPSAAPPQAILLVPTPDPTVALTAADLPAAVLLARAMGHARMASTATLRAAGLGPLAAACPLPQDGDTGCPLGDPHQLPRHDSPAALVPLPSHDDTTDVVAATTADAAWMLGVQWRLGEHAGEDAASPLQVEVEVGSAVIAEPRLATQPAEAIVEAGGWQPDRLVHAATWIGPAGGALRVPRHDAGALDWWAIRCERPVVADTREVVQRIPSRLRWPGQPRRRYWQVDDATLDPIGAGPDRAHPASLHLVDVVSRLGDDWYRATVPGRAGTFVGVAGAVLTDAAGGRWALRTDPGWSLFAVAGGDPDPTTLPPGVAFQRSLPVLLGALAALEGEPVEDLALAVDEDENVLWVAVRRGGGTPGGVPPLGPVGVPALARALHTAPLEVDWALGGAPPADRVPYLYGGLVPPGAFGHGADLFVRARLRDPVSGQLVPTPETELFQVPPEGGPHVLRPLAVPASGTRVVRRPVVARDTMGRPLRWYRSERLPLDAAVAVDMPWDVLTPRPEELPTTG